MRLNGAVVLALVAILGGVAQEKTIKAQEKAMKANEKNVVVNVVG